MSNSTLEFFRREREAFMQRSTSNTDEKFRRWLRKVFRDHPEHVSDAVADFVAERLSGRGKPAPELPLQSLKETHHDPR